MHLLLHLGSDREASPAITVAPDGGARKLVAYEGRIIHQDGSSHRFGIKDLHTVSLSNKEDLSTATVRIPSAATDLEPGDVLELVTVHEVSLRQLGMAFNLSDIPFPADRVSCRVLTSPGAPVQYVITDSSSLPEVSGGQSTGTTAFVWKNYDPITRSSGTARGARPADLLIADPLLIDPQLREPATWKEFGDWYLGVIHDRLAPSPEITLSAEAITRGAKSDREKMEAIFQYCQQKVRYSQIYLENGEFIPNTAETILARKYGDCKDYSLLMYVLARSVGLRPDLALCHRGRSLVFEESIPVSQFNHMILHFEDGDSCLWYDGTNRVGLPGLTSMDLVNTTALVLRQGASHLERIPEVGSNELVIAGSLDRRNQELRGTLEIRLVDQYAIDFFWSAFHMNEAEMREMLVAWLRGALAERIVVDNLSWRLEEQQFVMVLGCRLPNSILPVGSVAYVSLDGMFDHLLPRESDPGAYTAWYYYPHYGNVSIDVELTGLQLSSERPPQSTAPARIRESYRFPSGPFIGNEKGVFEERYQHARTVWAEQRKLSIKE